MGICLIVKSGGGVDTSSATATADKILSGYTIYKDDTKIIGTIRNIGNQNNDDTTWGNTGGKYNCWPDGTIWIWEGWHDGTSGVNAVSLSSQTGGFDMPGTDYCLWGYTYWTDGIMHSGTMPALGKQTWTIGANGTQTIGWGWHDGTGTVSQNIPIDDTEWGSGGATSDIKICWSGWYYTKNRWCYGASTLTADNIKKGVVIYGITGTCSTNLYLIKNGQLQYPVQYTDSGTCETMPSGAKAHYDSSLGAFVMYATEWSSSGRSYTSRTFPRFTGLSYPIINSTTSQTGVIHVEYMMPSPTQWASTSGPKISVWYNTLYAWSSTNAPDTPSKNTKVHAWSTTLSQTGTLRNAITGASVWINYGRAADGPSKIEKTTYVYNVWIDTTASLSK